MRIRHAFRHLSTKLTVLFAGLFGLALFAVALSVYAAISDNASRTVRLELSANGAVFDRVWAMREQQFRDSAGILARDFGFRDAVASQDLPTINSALDNLQERLRIDRAFIMGVDGQLIGLSDVTMSEADFIWSALDARESAAGVLMIGGRPYQAVSGPIRAPNLLGWVVFAAELNQDHLTSLEKLAAIPLKASVITRASGEDWRTSDATILASDITVFAKIIEHASVAGAAPQKVEVTGAPAIALVKPLNSFGDSGNSVLILRYPLALAMAGFQPLLGWIVIIGLISMTLIVAGSWVLARSITRPIAALDLAAHALELGERPEVVVETNDEIGRLAQTFNVMSGEIATREQRITHMALHDPDTLLPNRRALEAALQTHAKGYVLALTIVRYRQIREAIGFSLEVQLMSALGQKVLTALPEMRFGRLAADTIAIVVPLADETAALALSDDILARLEGPIAISGVQVDVALSAGLAHIRTAGDQVALDHALIAAEQARKGEHRVAFFDREAYGDPASNLSLMSEMIEGISRGQLTLHYQPKFDLRTNKVTGAEALVRWNHPTKGNIPPDVFVVMAEETGHIRPLTDWVLDCAIADQRVFLGAGHDLTISVNVSGGLIANEPFAERALREIRRSGARLCFEITETAVIENPRLAMDVMNELKSAGVSISIDDYGSGLSSLSYLRSIPAEELKIDKVFVQSLANGSSDTLLVKSTIDLAHSLGMKLTAEGVETAEVFSILRTMGADMVQGYYIARPLPVIELLDFMQDPAGFTAYGT